MSGSRRVLIIGGIALAVWGMGYGLWYAVFAEHQALDTIGASLATGFAAAAERDPAAMEASLDRYREAKYIYDRQVDAHGHWIGLAMLLIVLGIGFDRAPSVLAEDRLRWIRPTLLRFTRLELTQAEFIRILRIEIFEDGAGAYVEDAETFWSAVNDLARCSSFEKFRAQGRGDDHRVAIDAAVARHDDLL